MKPYGDEVIMDGQRYIVTADGSVYVEINQAREIWRELPHNGARAAAVRHQHRSGHSS